MSPILRTQELPLLLKRFVKPSGLPRSKTQSHPFHKLVRKGVTQFWSSGWAGRTMPPSTIKQFKSIRKATTEEAQWAVGAFQAKAGSQQHLHTPAERPNPRTIVRPRLFLLEAMTWKNIYWMKEWNTHRNQISLTSAECLDHRERVTLPLV